MMTRVTDPQDELWNSFPVKAASVVLPEGWGTDGYHPHVRIGAAFIQSPRIEHVTSEEFTMQRGLLHTGPVLRPTPLRAQQHHHPLMYAGILLLAVAVALFFLR